LKFSDFIDVPVVDCHVHHRIQDKDMTALQEKGEALVETIRRSGLEQMYVFGKNDHVSLELKRRYPGQFYAGGYVPWTGETREFKEPDWHSYTDQLNDMGYEGVGEMGSKPVTRGIHVPLDSKYYTGFWESCEEYNFPVLCHIGDVEDFWYEDLTPDWAKNRGWGYYNGDYPSLEEFYTEITHVLEKHTEPGIVLCHFLFMSPDLERATDFLETYGNANLDISPGVELLYNISRRRDDWRDFFVRFDDRIFFGTDIGMSSTVQEHLDRVWLMRNFLESDEEFYTPDTADVYLTRYEEPFIGLDLPRTSLEKIYSKNFKRLWGDTPKKVN
jgi:Tat protein secretion system quality control protein TatD with DNase activity